MSLGSLCAGSSGSRCHAPGSSNCAGALDLVRRPYHENQTVNTLALNLCSRECSGDAPPR